jgi:hypothetical protein
LIAEHGETGKITVRVKIVFAFFVPSTDAAWEMSPLFFGGVRVRTGPREWPGTVGITENPGEIRAFAKARTYKK